MVLSGEPGPGSHRRSPSRRLLHHGGNGGDGAGNDHAHDRHRNDRGHDHGRGHVHSHRCDLKALLCSHDS